MINATDLYFITRYCDNMSDNYSSFYPNLQQVVWTWNESYRTNKSFYLLNFDVELQLEKLIITVKVYESKLNGDEKELTTYITHMTDINFIKLIEQLNAFKESGKLYIEEVERCN